MRRRSSPRPPSSLSPTSTPRRTSRTPEPGSARSSIASRACDACRARRRKCRFDEGEGEGEGEASPRAAVQNRTQNQTRTQCRDCRRLGIETPPVNVRRERWRAAPRESGANQVHRQPVEPALNNSEPVLVLPESNHHPHPPRTSQARSPFEASPNLIHGPSPHAAAHSHLNTESPSVQVANPGYPTDELCSRRLIHVLMADYLDLVYPLVPVVHRPSFRHDLATNRDVTDPDFSALLISLCALVVGLLPSRFRDYRAVDPEAGRRFGTTRTAMIDRCAEICMRQRTARYWDRINHRKWAVCYVLSVACFQTGQVNRSRMFDVEYLQLSRLLGLHRISEYEGLNCIETQLRKKAFWMLFYGYAVQTGRGVELSYFGPGELREVNYDALMPLAIDDEHILRDRILDPARPSRTTTTTTTVAAVPHDTPPTTHAPKPRCRRRRAGPAFVLADGFNIHSSVFLKGLHEEMRTVMRGQAEVMRANIHVTHLWLQSLLLEKVEVVIQESALGNPSSGVGAAAAAEEVSEALRENWAEREDICRQMLHLLHSIPYVYLEPNGLYLTYKVRDVAVTLLNCPFQPHERPARRAVEYMRDFTRALSRLDRSETVNTNSLKSWVDVDREPAPA
ncbi:quinate utilization pathway activator [Colletotrichum higginsianum]|nr:quinate utilization pathway activator [Colletotrichum higginsianum]